MLIVCQFIAFGSDGQLIGVAGIDIYPEEFNSTLRDSVYRALETRTAKGNMPAPVASINLACSYQVSTAATSNPLVYELILVCVDDNSLSVCVPTNESGIMGL